MKKIILLLLLVAAGCERQPMQSATYDLVLENLVTRFDELMTRADSISSEQFRREFDILNDHWAKIRFSSEKQSRHTAAVDELTQAFKGCNGVTRLKTIAQQSNPAPIDLWSMREDFEQFYGTNRLKQLEETSKERGRLLYIGEDGAVLQQMTLEKVKHHIRMAKLELKPK
jgi:hypothetical protein